VRSLGDKEGGVITFMTVVSTREGRGGEKRAREVLRRASELYGVRAETIVAVGDDVADLVVDEARNHDLVTLGMRGEPLLRKFFFGSLAHQIATRSECPSIPTKTAVGKRKRFQLGGSRSVEGNDSPPTERARRSDLMPRTPVGRTDLDDGEPSGSVSRP
jgi:hypothetical protein